MGSRSPQPCLLCPRPGPAHCPGPEAQGAAQPPRLLAHDPPSLSFLGSACGQRGGGPAPGAPRLKVEGTESPSSPAPCSWLLNGTETPVIFSPISAKDLKSALTAFPVWSLFGDHTASVGVRHGFCPRGGAGFWCHRGKPFSLFFLQCQACLK